MFAPVLQTLRLEVVGTDTVSALLQRPAEARACYAFAHGAGAGMDHPFMRALAAHLCERGIAVLRYQFPYMERGSKRPDSPPVAQATVRAAVAALAQHCPGIACFAGGKSYGGRMTSQAQATAPLLPSVAGLVFVGFPLHPAGEPGIERAAHLRDVGCPMLFLQGTRDELAQLDLIRGVVSGLGAHARLDVFDDADHSFHVRKQSGRTDAEVLAALADAMTSWMDACRT